MSGKWSDGPWKIDRHSNGRLSISDFAGKVADVEHWRVEREFNAKLLAAAPELHDTLEQILKLSNSEYDEWDAVERVLPEIERLAKNILIEINRK